jgi:hypothetical protein
MLKGRVAFAIVVLVAAAALVLGFSSAPASARSLRFQEVVIAGTSPAAVTAGQTYTINFELMRGDEARHIADVACYAVAGGRRAQLVDQGTDGTVGYCTWAIPRRAEGLTFDGIISAQADSGTWWNRGFDLPIS